MCWQNPACHVNKQTTNGLSFETFCCFGTLTLVLTLPFLRLRQLMFEVAIKNMTEERMD